MAGYKNYQVKNIKHEKQTSRTDIYDSEFTSFVKGSEKVKTGIDANLNKYVDMISYFKFYPDAFFDFVGRSKEGKPFRLDMDQRVILRALARFVSVYGVLSRGWAKTTVQVMAMFHACIFYPGKQIALVAQNKEASAASMKDKVIDLLREFPILQNEIEGKANMSKDEAEITFRNGSRITILPQNQSAKGKRRHTIYIDESALLQDQIFSDCLEPIVIIPRRPLGSDKPDPYELNHNISFFSTAGFRSSTEFQRNLSMLEDMEDLKGKLVIGASWELACAFGRGETRSQMLTKKETFPPLYWQMNYASNWSGSTDGALVQINKVMDLRTLTEAEFKSDGRSEYIIAMDVARSESTDNNQSSIAVLKLKRAKDDRIQKIQLVNLFNLRNGLTYSAQTAILKKIKNLFNAKIVVVDGNGLGSGVIDECIKDTVDPITNENLGCWKPMNNEKEPESDVYEECLFDLKATGINHDIILAFLNIIDGKKLQLLEQRQNSGYDIDDMDYFKEQIYPFIQTDLLLEEIANLKLQQKNNGKLGIEKNMRKIDKDRFSALAYGLYYIKTFIMDDFSAQNEDEKATDFLLIN